jgi:DNA processing protein
MDDQELRHWVALGFVEDLGGAGCRRLLDHFGSPRDILAAPETELRRVPRISGKAAEAVRRFSDWKRVDEELEKAARSSVSLFPMTHPDYPGELRHLPDPPPLLYVRGTLREEPAVAVVGSRRATAYGKFMTDRIVREMARHGITVVSGMARGIDTAAHWGALRAKGRTVAVLGSGIDVVYPAENGELFERIQGSGAVVTEFPFGTPPLAANFPARNRIISGLSLGVVVVEAGEKSGSLITARLALEQGKEVFAVPGSIDSPSSRGTHRLIRQGAKLVESIHDILEEIFPRILLSEVEKQSVRKDREPSALSREESRPGGAGGGETDRREEVLLRILKERPVHVDEMIQASGLDTKEVLSLLLSLELRGLVKQLPGKQFVLKERP